MIMGKKILFYIYHHMVKQTEESQHQITLFAVVMMINFPLFGVLWKFGSLESTDEFILRLIATGLCALLASHGFWSRSTQKLLPFLWYMTLLFCLPFFFAYVTLLYHGATSWLMNCVSAIFFLLLVTAVIDALVLLGLGLGSAFLLYYSGVGETVVYSPGNISLFSLVITFTAAIIIGALFARDKELINAGRVSGIRLLAGSLARDLRTPLASIHIQTALQESIVDKLTNAEVKQVLRESLQKITRGIEMGNQLISMQLNNIQQEKFNTETFSIYPIQTLLKKTLEDYPFIKDQHSEITVMLDEHFSIWIDELAFKNLIWNLLKNSLVMIYEAGHGDISIWLSRGDEKDDFNYLHIKDTAQKVYPEAINKLFHSFYTNRLEGLGDGLSYCKLLMQAGGGSIECQGKPNQYTHFILKFPKID